MNARSRISRQPFSGSINFAPYSLERSSLMASLGFHYPDNTRSLTTMIISRSSAHPMVSALQLQNRSILLQSNVPGVAQVATKLSLKFSRSTRDLINSRWPKLILPLVGCLQAHPLLQQSPMCLAIPITPMTTAKTLIIVTAVSMMTTAAVCVRTTSSGVAVRGLCCSVERLAWVIHLSRV